MAIAIKIENLSKQYRLGLVSTRTLSHDLNRWWQISIRRKEDPYLKVGEINDRATKGESEYVWALKDINLEVQEGEVLGIIGRNGAGKSTLLKILSKVTAPTTGIIKVRGRIASLLEVGTGFHQEMTGRENIFMNGAILGMTKTEIQKKFDEIVDFAGVERYIDTPVKRYSSGMIVRLGFAIAAYLEPEILVVDEVLAVGDAEFQKKAIGKMQDVTTKGGRTVLFVSHNMATIENLCNRTILINEGQIINSGNTKKIINSYLNISYELSQTALSNRIDRKGNQQLFFNGIEFINSNNNKVNSFSSGDAVTIRAFFNKTSNNKLRNCRVSLSLIKDDRPYVVLSSELVIKKAIDINESGYVDFKMSELPLSKGIYSLTLFFEANKEILDWIENAAVLPVEDGNFYGTGKSYPTGWEGKTVLIKHSIKLEH
jgi:lipopolysaccharide transport system ATP-binding protein